MDPRRLQDDLRFSRRSTFRRCLAPLQHRREHFPIKPAGVVLRATGGRPHLVKRTRARIALLSRGRHRPAGESLGTGLIVDLSKHFRQIVAVGADTIRVQPGVTHAAINARLAEIGRRFAPDPSNGAVCTIGGMLANNASGSRALKYGYTRGHVSSLRAVLDNGDAVNINKERLPHLANGATNHLHDVIAALNVLLEENRERLRRASATRFNRSAINSKACCRATRSTCRGAGRLRGNISALHGSDVEHDSTGGRPRYSPGERRQYGTSNSTGAAHIAERPIGV